jgi:hypothetical protein
MLSVHVGQTGLNVGTAVWEQYCPSLHSFCLFFFNLEFIILFINWGGGCRYGREHGIDPSDGRLVVDDGSHAPPPAYYHETEKGCYRPRYSHHFCSGGCANGTHTHCRA